ncbi:MAG: PIN domain-containing protein [Propionibacteriaceae bacterium]|nr:PIN domain-containing protein [Propionibacteriaceae bacterium]
MIALDTNLIVYAHREDSPHHLLALAALTGLLQSQGQVGLPWPCVHEFLAVVTHPRVYQPPSTMAQALAAVRALTDSPRVQLLAEQPHHLDTLGRLLARGDIRGPRVHDARIAAICLDAGVTELWSADRDYSWFPALRVVNPLVHHPA